MRPLMSMSSDSIETRVLDDGAPVGHLALPGVRLVVIEGPDRGLEVTPGRGVIRLGTAPDNEVVLHDSAISRRNAKSGSDRHGSSPVIA